jgi:hypothetical protein
MSPRSAALVNGDIAVVAQPTATVNKSEIKRVVNIFFINHP